MIAKIFENIQLPHKMNVINVGAGDSILLILPTEYLLIDLGDNLFNVLE